MGLEEEKGHVASGGMRPIVSPLEFLLLWSFWERGKEKEGGGIEGPLGILKAYGQIPGVWSWERMARFSGWVETPP